MGFGIGLKSHGRRPMKNGFRPIFRLADDPLLDEKKLEAFFPDDCSELLLYCFLLRSPEWLYSKHLLIFLLDYIFLLISFVLSDFVLLKFLSLGTVCAVICLCLLPIFLFYFILIVIILGLFLFGWISS